MVIIDNFGHKDYNRYYGNLCEEEKDIFEMVVNECNDYDQFRDKIFEMDFDEELLWECAKNYCSIKEFEYSRFLNWIADDFYDCLNKGVITLK